MPVETFKPGPSGGLLTDQGKVVGHMSFGGPELLMPIGARDVLFEMHHYLGPVPLNKRTGEAMDRIPSEFWGAFERWEIGGKLVDDNACIVPTWCRKCDGTGEEIQGHEVIGYCKTCNGVRVDNRKGA